eukprot:m.1569809 g.1569809  ORF g.1569809 m.1569809 type:complete len:360 (+) comp25301_c0_seq1:103-1182(+)
MHGRSKQSLFRARTKSSCATSGLAPSSECFEDTVEASSQTVLTDKPTSPNRENKKSLFSPRRFFKGSTTAVATNREHTQTRDRSKTAECLTSSQSENVAHFQKQFSSCTYAGAVEALKACDWDMSVACVLQEKLERANAMLEVEQKALLEQALDQYVTKFNEAVDIQKKMDTMAAVLAAEEAELAAQERMVEIDRFEEENYPEKDEKMSQLSAGDDEFTKEMKERGLRHVTGGGEEIRIKYDMLPPELDITTAFQDAPPMPSPSRVRGLQRTRHDSDTDDQTVGTSRTDSPPTGARDNDGRSHSDSELHKTSMLLVGEVDNAPSAFGPCKLAPPGHIDMLGGLTAAKSMQELSDIFLKR